MQCGADGLGTCSHRQIAEELGVRDVVLYYRRRDIDMPLAQPPDNATAEQLEKTQLVRKKILSKLNSPVRKNGAMCLSGGRPRA